MRGKTHIQIQRYYTMEAFPEGSCGKREVKRLFDLDPSETGGDRSNQEKLSANKYD